jgi:pilus assembly protein CpaB
LKRANKFMLFAGVLLAGVAFVAVLAFGGVGAPTVVTPPADVSVVVAAVDLSLGTALTPDQLTTQTRPQAEASGTYQRPDELVGKIVRRTVVAGQVLTADDFETNALDQIATSLQPGLRAIALPLSRVDSVGALLQPGDRVDAIIAMTDLDGLNPIVQPNPNAGTPTIDGSLPEPYIILDTFLNNTTVKVVVQNVQVLAVQLRTVDQENMVQSSGQPEPDVVVILAVTPQQAEIVRYGDLDGNISLVLRAPGDAGAADVDTSGITLRWLVDNYGVLPPAAVTP